MASDTPLISRLADEISRNAGILTEYLESHGLPQPSFDVDAPSHPIPETDERLSAARRALIEATQSLHDLAVGPAETTRLFCFPEIYLLGAVQVLCHFNVPQNVPRTGDIGIPELAAKTGLSETLLARFLRMAATSHYFVEPRPGFVAHTAWSVALAADEKMRQCVWFRHAEMMPAVAKLVEAVRSYPDSHEPQRAAFAVAFGGDTFWDYKEKHPEHMVRFGQFVDAFASGHVVDSPQNIARAYPWERLEEGSLVVDVGGGLGHISVAVAKEHPNLVFQVQDFEDLARESAELAERSGLAGRVSFAPHDFFGEQPARGAKVYLLRNILHNWSDRYCRRILKPLVEAMGPGSRIVVCDIVLPPPNTMPKTQKARIRALDLTMLSMFNAKERSLEEWQALFASVDGRLKIENVIGRPKMRMDCLIEVRLA